MEKKANKANNPYFLWAFIGVIAAWVVWRAASLCMTHDESATFLYVYHSFADILQGESCFDTGNNHIINTLLTKTCYHVLGDSAFSLRLPNVLVFVLYVYAGLSLLKLWTNRPLIWLLGLMILLCYPYLLDFFSLCRGYGLAMAWLTTSLLFFYQYLAIKRDKYLIATFATALLAVLSHFTFLNYFIALFFVVWLYEIVYLFLATKEENSLLKQVKALSIAVGFALILALFIVRPILFLRKKGEFTYGGSDFLPTVDDFIRDFLYTTVSDTKLLFFKGLLCLFLLGLVFRCGQLLLRMIKQKAFLLPYHSFFLLLSILFFTIVVSTIAQHHLLGTAYLTHRTATIYIPILQLLTFLTWHQFVQKYPQYLLKGAFILPLLYLYNLGDVRNLHYVREWWYDEDTKEVLQYVNQQVKPGEKVNFACHWWYTPTARFYQKTLPLPAFDSIMYNKAIVSEPLFDYYYVNFADLKEVSNIYTVVARYGYDRMLLKKDTSKFAKRRAELLAEIQPGTKWYEDLKIQAENQHIALSDWIDKAILWKMGQEKIQLAWEDLDRLYPSK